MKLISCAFFIMLLCRAIPSLSATDSGYVCSFQQRYTVSLFTTYNILQLHSSERDYTPNSPLSLGFGFSVKNTFINAKQGFSVWQPGRKAGGNTRAFDMQLHQYGRNFIADVLYQEYRGFYYKDKHQEQEQFTNMYIRQMGIEGTYIFKGGRFSAKAAFEQSEQQLRSAGSWVAGGNVFISQVQDLQVTGKEPIDNVQVGINAGYAYTWVINPHWRLSGMATAGINVGNEWALVQKGRLNAYPSALARCAASYHSSDWTLYWSMLLHNKTLYPDEQQLDLTSVNMQVAYIRRFNSLKFSRLHGHKEEQL